ncbi:MAG: MAPEG family protein [Paucibacter sp.]|nr:MAPEG family protein [Roseateles sp.]
MTIANICIIAACMLPVLTAGLGKGPGYGKPRREGGYDNAAPRAWADKLTGWQARAMAAQNNGFEALPLFIAAVLVAQQNHAAQDRIDMLAMAFVAIRVVYTALYLGNKPALRSGVWSLGVISCIAMFFVG